jgi:hypothetical protein
LALFVQVIQSGDRQHAQRLPRGERFAVCLTSTILTARRQLFWPVEAGDEFKPLLA